MAGKLKSLFLPKGGKGKELLTRYYGVALVLLAGIILMLWPADGNSAPQEDCEDPGTAHNLQAEEKKLQELLECVEGVGKVRVMLTLQESSRQILAQEHQLRYSGSPLQPEDYEKEESTLTVSRGSGSEEVVVTQTVYPQYRGALVVCSGGDRAEVKLAVTEAVSVITGLRSDRISVCVWGDE